MRELSGRSALITGASRGIGEAIARKFAKYGVRVVLAARSEGEISRIADEIVQDGGQAQAIACDVSSYAEVAAAVEKCTATFGSLDILVNNAGVIDPISRLADSDPEQWATTVDVNLKGVYYGLRAAIPVMERQGSGVIVNFSSGAAANALEGWSHYCAAKAAVALLTQCADKEYRDKGIRVVGIRPGTVATEMQVSIKASGINPISQLDFSDHISPEWAAEAVAWLCTADAEDQAGLDFSLKDDAARRRVGLIS